MLQWNLAVATQAPQNSCSTHEAEKAKLPNETINTKGNRNNRIRLYHAVAL